MQFLADGAWNKRFHTGYASMSGLIAAACAAESYRGARDALEGAAGFLKSYAPNARIDEATAGIGAVFETLQIAVKPYPSCRYGHAALDALLALRAEHAIDPSDIRSVEIGLPHTGHKIIGEPLAAKRQPKNVVDGQFSMPFVAAVALREGRMAWDDYPRHLTDTKTLALCQRVHTVVDPLAEREYPRNMSAVARVQTAAGHLEKVVIVPRGEPENFPTQAELVAKFDTLAAPYLSPSERASVVDTLLEVDSAASVAGVCALLRPQAQELAGLTSARLS
jgi:2-methylcitrate dehydratase PrpD